MDIIPLELHREIAQQLDPAVDIDRQSLCNLSLTNQHWREEGQRVLFRYGPVANPYSFAWMAVADTHTKFLKAIKDDSSGLLAKYVRCYSQVSQRLYPQNRELPQNLIVEMLWDLTAEVLPHLDRLAYLHLTLVGSGYQAMHFLRKLSAQLQTLSWNGPGCAVVVSEFLPTQHSLKNLSLLESLPEDRDCERIARIPGNICPVLSSIEATFIELWRQTSPRHSITKLCLIHCIDRLRPDDLGALNRLTHLRLFDLSQIEELLEARVSLDMVLLELYETDRQCIDTLRSLTFTRLRVLVVGLVDEAIEHTGHLREFSMRLFMQCLTLVYIIIPTNSSVKGAYRFHRIKTAEDADGGNSFRMEEDEFTLDSLIPSRWWTPYDDMLKH